MRPGMYIGGTDERALHHLFAEVLDNSMDEAVAGHANLIEVYLDAEGYLTVTDNGRGIPVEPHPQVPGKSALEVIMTMLHSGGKFDGKAYETSGGLHGVGVSVVNALSDDLEVEVARNRKLYRQRFSRGMPQGGLEELGDVHNRRGTRVRFHPDPQIFGDHATLQAGPPLPHGALQGLSVRRRRDPLELRSRAAAEGSDTPDKAVFHFPGGLADYLRQRSARTSRSPARSSPAGPKRPAATARSNGPSPGMAAIRSSIPTATPSRRPKAARTRPACAPR